MENEINTYLDLYSPVKDGKPATVYHRLNGMEAYDGWHCLVYLKEIMLYRQLAMQSDLRFKDLPRKEKNVMFYVLLKALSHIKNITELGSSLMELIDGLEAVNTYYLSSGKQGLNGGVDGYNFIGIDSSEFLRQVSEQLHLNAHMKLVDHVVKMPDYENNALFDRAVSSYAFTNSEDLAAFLGKFNVALLNLFVSKEETFISSTSGGAFTYFSIKELVANLKHPLFHLFGFKSPSQDKSMGKPVIEGFFFYGPKDLAERFIQETGKIPEINEYFLSKEISLREVTPSLSLI